MTKNNQKFEKKEQEKLQKIYQKLRKNVEHLLKIDIKSCKKKMKIIKIRVKSHRFGNKIDINQEKIQKTDQI